MRIRWPGRARLSAGQVAQPRDSRPHVAEAGRQRRQTQAGSSRARGSPCPRRRPSAPRTASPRPERRTDTWAPRRRIARAADSEAKRRQPGVMELDRVVGQGDRLCPDPLDPASTTQRDALIDGGQRDDGLACPSARHECPAAGRSPGRSRTGRAGPSSPGSDCASPPSNARRMSRKAGAPGPPLRYLYVQPTASPRRRFRGRAARRRQRG